MATLGATRKVTAYVPPAGASYNSVELSASETDTASGTEAAAGTGAAPDTITVPATEFAFTFYLPDPAASAPTGVSSAAPKAAGSAVTSSAAAGPLAGANAASAAPIDPNAPRVRIAPHGEAIPVIEGLGQPAGYFEAPSCAYQGIDKTYTYAAFELITYPLGGKDFIQDIYFLDGTVYTEEGIHIGSTKAEVVAAYDGGIKSVSIPAGQAGAAASTGSGAVLGVTSAGTEGAITEGASTEGASTALTPVAKDATQEAAGFITYALGKTKLTFHFDKDARVDSVEYIAVLE
jgi:hypothetical protein